MATLLLPERNTCPFQIETVGDQINRECRLGGLILETHERLVSLEKLARKTPPKTLLVEVQRVNAAKASITPTRDELRKMLSEHAGLRRQLGRDDSGLSEEYMAIRNAEGVNR
jgi:hypothetical protein